MLFHIDHHHDILHLFYFDEFLFLYEMSELFIDKAYKNKLEFSVKLNI